MKISTLGIKNSTVHIHAAAAHRITGFIFDHVQFAGIHCRLGGTVILTLGLSFSRNLKIVVRDEILGVGVLDELVGEGAALDLSASPRSPFGAAIEGASTRQRRRFYIDSYSSFKFLANPSHRRVT